MLTGRKYLVTLITDGADGTQNRLECGKRLTNTCVAQGIDATRFVWSWQRFKTTVFYKAYLRRFVVSKHLSYWLWKPYIIMDALINTNDGDIIMMIDSDINVVSDLSTFYPFIDEQDIVSIGHGLRNDQYTTGDAFAMMDCLDERYRGADHIWGAMLFFKRGPKAMNFIHDFEMLSANEELMTSQGQYIPNFPGFAGTRWLQGVLTNLMVIHNIPILNNIHAQMFHHPPY